MTPDPGRDARPTALPAPTPAPVANPQAFPIVGIGASAGGLAAFEAFFSGMPADADPGMAFVLVQHLAPDHKSLLSELIRRYTRMEVFEVENGMVVRPNCAYIIPPNRDMAFVNGTLQLLEPAAPRGQRLPIDFFFHSLAADQHERAVGIVLSGTGSDGTMGVRAIKGEGGMVMAQSTASSEFDGMPRSAIATGLVDYELPPAEMPARLIAYAARMLGAPTHGDGDTPPGATVEMNKVFILLRAQTGHDFSQYKPSTVQRRIRRRMAVHQIEGIGDYIKYMQKSAPEVEALFRDLLIGVTSFFRDPQAFALLAERVIPQLFAGKPPGAAVRVWSAGCSTGEEAYSIAILLTERMQALHASYAVQVFATDIDAQAVATARAGLYPPGAVAGVSPERLARYFVAEPDGSGFRVHKSVRDLLVFSEQDVIKDPPFSRLDLVICRNLLIYMGADLQRRLIPLFHYALNPGGHLFLGNSEGVGEYDALFAVVDRESKLYRRQASGPGVVRPKLARHGPAPRAADTAMPRAGLRHVDAGKLSLRELTEQALLTQVVPAAALVNDRGDILYLHGRSGPYLELAAGETGVNNILRMARDGLRPALSAALHRAASTHEAARGVGHGLRVDGRDVQVRVCVLPLPAPGGQAAAGGASASPPLFLVTFEELTVADPRADAPSSPPGAAAPDDANEDSMAALLQDLRAKDEYLQSMQEELESANEELKSSNEEMQSVNEELQSANEELETSKEELQSVNEELATVNAELQTKVTDLTLANNDMNNLLAGTRIGTVFVDHALRIVRFTPAAAQITNLIPGDIGRPVGHIVSNLVGYDRLVADTQAMLATLIPKDVEVQTLAGQWYTMRIQPYRTLENVIMGAVITFFDITEVVRAREALRQANDLSRLALLVRDASDAITVQDLLGRILAWNPAAEKLYGWNEAEAMALPPYARIPPGLREQAQAMIEQARKSGSPASERTLRLNRAGASIDVSVSWRTLVDAEGQVYAVATTERAAVEGGPP
jgi:two-component system, chemotaxis family, CheB/CheR fusion protein